MSSIYPSWWREWVDLDTPLSEPIKLKENVPKDIKKKFEEWEKQKKEERSNGIWK